MKSTKKGKSTNNLILNSRSSIISSNCIKGLLDSMEDIVFTLDLKQHYTGVYGLWIEKLGLTPDFFLGKTVGEIFDRKAAEVHEKASKKALAGKSVKCEWSNLLKGSIHYFETTLSPIYNAENQITGIAGMGRDVTERKKDELVLTKALARIRKTLGTIIHVLTITLESRDPYTVGHQKRVANIARYIAHQINLPSGQIEGVRVAASIHDIGKISIPAEILTKPSKLSEAEFSLVKAHSSSGYEILRNIDFPWPVARIVLEHHERNNGSGYPHQLKAKEILLESKILAVADTLDAISSQRPYRLALGIEAAIDEISDNKGRLYDTQVVDACLKFIKQKGIFPEYI